MSEILTKATEKEDNFESDGEDDDSEELGFDVQLGFIDKDLNNTLFNEQDWRNWDGGKIGGQPVWLNREVLPSAKRLTCAHCSNPMMFLMQMYCPVDANSDAYHRSLYLFLCKRRECLNRGSVKCIRSQLPRLNRFYSEDPANPAPSNSGFCQPNLCALCGCEGKNACSQCKCTFYCSKSHQKAHWKCHKLICKEVGVKRSQIAASAAFQDAENAAKSRHLFKEFGLVVEEEIFPEQEKEELKSIMERANVWEDAVTEGGEDEELDASLTQADYNRALQSQDTGNQEHDPTYIHFLTRVSRGGSDQVLRYCRGSSDFESSSSEGARSSQGLLLLSSNKALLQQRAEQLVAKPCERCGRERVFECQVMPQLLHFLHVDKHTQFGGGGTQISEMIQAKIREEENGSDESTTSPPQNPFVNSTETDIDFGTLDIFTCSGSCDLNTTTSPNGDVDGMYQEELVLIQPSVYNS